MNLIEKLEQERGYYLQEYQSCLDSHDVVNAIDSCIDIVKQHSEWVSIDKQLPSDRGYFLVRLNTGEITVDYYDYDNGHWSKNYGNVTHFMRLPQPPSEVHKMSKRLTHVVFKDAPPWVKSAAIDEDGEAFFYEVPKENLIPDSSGMWRFYKVDPKRLYNCVVIDTDYDTSNWQYSAINRESEVQDD